MEDELLHLTLHRLGSVSLGLVNLALDDRDEPYTPEDRAEVVWSIVALIGELSEKLGGEIAARDLARSIRIRAMVRRELGL